MNELSPEDYKILKTSLGSREWRLNNLYHVINDEDKDVIFKQRPVQKYFDVNRWYWSMVLKSRQHGITTGELIIMLDKVLFGENIRTGMIAHKQESAEKLFEKVHYAYSKLPDIIKEIAKPTKETGSIMRFQNNSSIEVSTSFMSGTLTHLHISEMGYICQRYPDKANEIVRGSINTLAPGSILTIESTSRGRTGWFAEQCMKAMNNKRSNKKLSVKDFRFFFFGWLQNKRDNLDPVDMSLYPSEIEYFKRIEEEVGFKILPSKKAFYVVTQETQGENMFSEFPTTPEEAFKKRLDGAWYGHQMFKARDQKRIGAFPHQPGYKVNTSWDIGKGAHMVVWFWQEIGYKIFVIDCISEEDYELKDYINDITEKDYRYGMHCFPHDLKQSELMTDITRRQYLQRMGLARIKLVPKIPFADGITNVKELLPNCYFNDIPATEKGIMALEEYSRKWDRVRGEYTDMPVKNWTEHYADAFKYLAIRVNYTRIKESKRNNVDTSNTNSPPPSWAGWV